MQGMTAATHSLGRGVGSSSNVVATFGLSDNHTQRRLDAAPAVIGFNTYPYVDSRTQP